MSELNIPYPIIYGRERPQLRMRLEGGKQYLYSITNFNLYIDETSLNERGDFPIISLLRRSSRRSGVSPRFAESKRLTAPWCLFVDSCRDLCPMIFESCEKLQLNDDQPGIWLSKVQMHSKPQLDKCKALSTLLNLLTTPAEKKLAEMYYNWAICGLDYSHYVPIVSTLPNTYVAFLKLWQEQQLHYSSQWAKTPEAVARSILEALDAPALLPQVWLNYTYNPKESPHKEEDDAEHMPKRVDFLFIKDRKVYIVEVDDPSHYAKYDEYRKTYDVDEERYTSNLKAERSLRNQGFEIRRLSNREVLNSTEPQLLQLLSDGLDINISRYPPKPELPPDIPF